MRFDLEGTQEIGEQEITWVAEIEGSYRPAQLFGRPEDCYEAEGEMDILALTTWPPGYEGQIDEDAVVDAAWERYHELRAEGEAP